jgi:glycosyltransferase involved in cell wall biosynthesis
MSRSNPAAPEIFPCLEELLDGAADVSPRRVCIACGELSGPDNCGGVGTAMRALALALAEDGHDVSVVLVTLPERQAEASTWKDFFAENGIGFTALAPPDAELDWGTFSRPASVLCYKWLRAQPAFDVIHFHDYLGLGYYTQLAKGQGLAFAGTTIFVGAHGSLRWDRIGNRRFGSGYVDLTLDFLERQSVERADIVVSPSQHLLRWMRQDGWRLPPRSCVQANVLEAVPTLEEVERRSRGVPVDVDELVFFGRLDGRKGLDLFIDAVEALLHRGEPCPKLTFLGRPVLVGGKPAVDFIQARAGRLGRRPQLLTRMSRDDALRYLRSGPRLAVMPSWLDNAPCTVQECLAAGIPFLTTDVGGTPELIHPEDRAAATCAPSPDRLAERFAHILTASRLARLAPRAPPRLCQHAPRGDAPVHDCMHGPLRAPGAPRAGPASPAPTDVEGLRADPGG